MTAAPDGSMYFTNLPDAKGLVGNSIGRITSDGNVTTIPTAIPLGELAFGPEGNIWFAGHNDIGEMKVYQESDKSWHTALLHDYHIPSADSSPYSWSALTIAIDDHGNVWYTEPYVNNLVGRITPDGHITEFNTGLDGYGAGFIINGPDGNRWFGANDQPTIGRVQPDGKIDLFPMLSTVRGLTVGPVEADGSRNLWMTGNNQIYKVNTAGQCIGQFAIHTDNSGSYWMTTGPDGALWFTELNANQIGRITTDGKEQAEYPIPTQNSQPDTMSAGLGTTRDIWFTENGANQIGHIVLGLSAPGATTWQVNSTSDDGSAGTLRWAVSQANLDAALSGNSETIQFDPSLAGRTITLTQGQLELSWENAVAITIDGSSLPTPVTISGNSGRIFQVDAVHAELDGLILVGGGRPMNGGAILNYGVLTLNACTLSGNHAEYQGGAIFNSAGGILRLNGTLIAENSAGSVFHYGAGGAIYNQGTLSLSGSTLRDNVANFGGGLYQNASGTGGGIFNEGAMSLSGSILRGNVANGGSFNGSSWSGTGGGIFNRGGTLTISGSTLSGNTATGYFGSGGGIYNYVGTLTVRGSTFSGNTTSVIDGDGAAINNYGGTLTMDDSTLAANSSRNVLFNTGTMSLSGSTLSGNTGQGIFNTGTMSLSGSTLSGNSDRGIVNGGTLTVTGTTLSGNSDGGIDNGGTLTVSGCTLSGNVAFSGGGLRNFGTLTISGSTLSGNSASYAGGGIYNQGVLTVENEIAADFYGAQTALPDLNSAVFGNQAPSGADIENYGNGTVLNIYHGAVGAIDNTADSPPTINVLPTDTATVLTSSVDPSLPGQAVFSVQVLAAQAGAPTPTGTITLYDGTNARLDDPTTLVSGHASFTVSLDAAGRGPVHAVYSGDGSFSGSTSAPVVATVVDAQQIMVDPQTGVTSSPDLQDVVNRLASSSSGTGVQVILDPDSFYPSSLQTVANAIAQVIAPDGIRVVITLNAPLYNYGDLMLSTQPHVSLVVNFANGTQVVGNSPALVVTGGDITIANATFRTATDSPTILVSRGGLTLRRDIVQSSTGYNDAAIAVSDGSTLDLGTSASPGGNTIIVHGAGQVLASTGPNFITTTGNSFQLNGTAVHPFATVSLAVSSASPLLSQLVTFTATVSAPASGSAAPTGTVTFMDMTTGTTLGVVPLSNDTEQWTTSTLTLGQHRIAAVYSGDGNYLSNSAGTSVRVIPRASLSGLVFVDFNDDGQSDFGEHGIAGVAVALTGTDDLGQAVSLRQLTDADGAYVFLNLRPGIYDLTETQPGAYGQGIDSIGTSGGRVIATDEFFVQLAQGVNGMNYNYGERPPASGSIQRGQSATIGFWNNKNGQALIKAFNSGTGHQLADWLAATLPNIFGVNAGSNNLSGMSNAYVAALFQQDFLMKGIKLDAQVLATALSVYATNATLDATAIAAQYGFTVQGDGVGAATVNVGSNGDAFGVANNTSLTLMDLLLATDQQAVNGILYNGDATKRKEANDIYTAINQAGDIH